MKSFLLSEFKKEDYGNLVNDTNSVSHLICNETNITKKNMILISKRNEKITKVVEVVCPFSQEFLLHAVESCGTHFERFPAVIEERYATHPSTVVHTTLCAYNA